MPVWWCNRIGSFIEITLNLVLMPSSDWLHYLLSILLYIVSSIAVCIENCVVAFSKCLSRGWKWSFKWLVDFYQNNQITRSWIFSQYYVVPKKHSKPSHGWYLTWMSSSISMEIPSKTSNRLGIYISLLSGGCRKKHVVKLFIANCWLQDHLVLVLMGILVW